MIYSERESLLTFVRLRIRQKRVNINSDYNASCRKLLIASFYLFPLTLSILIVKFMLRTQVKRP